MVPVPIHFPLDQLYTVLGIESALPHGFYQRLDVRHQSGASCFERRYAHRLSDRAAGDLVCGVARQEDIPQRDNQSLVHDVKAMAEMESTEQRTRGMNGALLESR